jgi:hypothetical protein
MVFSATFNNIYSGSQFYWWMKTEYPEKTTDLSQVTDKFYSYKLTFVSACLTYVVFTFSLRGSWIYNYMCKQY